MSEEEKEPSEPGLGLRSIMEMIELKRQLADWAYANEEWRGSFRVQQIAKALMSEQSNEQIALMAAQLWLERQALETAVEILIRKSGEQISVADAAAFTSAALKAYSKTKWGKGGKARNAESTKMKGDALAAWDAHGANVSSMAAFSRARHKDFGVAERTLYGWIREHRRDKP